MTDHTQRLTTSNRKLVIELNEAREFIKRLTNPEDLGHAVTDEVRKEAARLLAGKQEKAEK